MRSLFIFILLSLFFAQSGKAVPLKKESFINIFQIDLKSEDRILKTQSSNLFTGILLSKTSRTYIFAQPHPAQSINSVKIRAKEHSVSPDKIIVTREKAGAVFSFEDDKYIYFYSTIGGKLIIAKNGKEKFDNSRVHLKLKKSSKSVAKL